MVACNGTVGITKEKDSPGAQHQSVLFLILDVLQKEKNKVIVLSEWPKC